jgi:hypothetical protein
MSQYLSQFYCGNKRHNCNYNEPIDYSKLMNRHLDLDIHKMLDECQGKDFEKGYCCDVSNKELHKLMDEEWMEKINKDFEANVFTKDNYDNFHRNQIPLIKPLTRNGKLEGMDVCACGGDSQEYAQCVNENCNDYRYPTRYEYCKLGSELNKIHCIDNNNELSNGPSSSDAPSTSSSPQDRCVLRPSNYDSQFTHSKSIRIENLPPDCYLNLCNKNPKLSSLDNMTYNDSNKNKLFNVKGHSLEQYKYKKTDEQLQNNYKKSGEGKSLLNYFSM